MATTTSRTFGELRPYHVPHRELREGGTSRPFLPRPAQRPHVPTTSRTENSGKVPTTFLRRPSGGKGGIVHTRPYDVPPGRCLPRPAPRRTPSLPRPAPSENSVPTTSRTENSGKVALLARSYHVPHRELGEGATVFFACLRILRQGRRAPVRRPRNITGDHEILVQILWVPHFHRNVSVNSSKLVNKTYAPHFPCRGSLTKNSSSPQMNIYSPASAHIANLLPT